MQWAFVALLILTEIRVYGKKLVCRFKARYGGFPLGGKKYLS